MARFSSIGDFAQPALASNLVQSASLFLAIPLFSVVGIWALVGVNILGTVMANVVVIQRLKRYRYAFRIHKGFCQLIIGLWLRSGGSPDGRS